MVVKLEIKVIQVWVKCVLETINWYKEFEIEEWNEKKSKQPNKKPCKINIQVNVQSKLKF